MCRAMNTQENSFGKIREKLYFLEKLLATFRTMFGNLKIKGESWEKKTLDRFRENNFSENCEQIIGEFPGNFHFWHKINYLLTGLFVLYREILTPQFYARTQQARSVFKSFNLSISWCGSSMKWIKIKHHNGTYSSFVWKRGLPGKTIKVQVTFK